MTKKQDFLYWSEWKAVGAACKKQNLPCPDRHELHVKALGKDISHKVFSNADFDKVLGVFRAISKPASVNDQVRQLRQEQTRLNVRILNEQVPCITICNAFLRVGPSVPRDQVVAADEDIIAAENYVMEVMEGKFGTRDISQVSAVQKPRGLYMGKPQWNKSDLETLRDTLAARINELRNDVIKAGRGEFSIHDMKIAANVPCSCAECARQPVENLSPEAREALAQ
jgi:hypothetical protein